MPNKQKSKRERFETVASNRVKRVLNDLELLSKCANTNNYEYTSGDVQKMFRVIKDKLKNVEALYIQKTTKNNSFHF